MSTAQIPQPIRDISDFRLFTTACEFRFQNSYHLWDRAGEIWSDFVAANPEAKLVKADPGQTTFRLGSQREFTVNLDRFGVNAHVPSSTDAFAAEADEFAKSVSRHLKVGSYSRIGLRTVFVREYPDIGAATVEMLGLKLLWVPNGPFFGISGTPSETRYSCRLEDKSKGCLIQIFVNKREFEPELPFAWEGDKILRVEKNDLVMDIDYYTIASTSIGQLNVQEWIKQGMHVIRRDINKIIGGTGWPQRAE
jgi:hypothetical protein